MDDVGRRKETINRLRPYVERARRLRGFTLEVKPIRFGPPQPWDYVARARELLAGSARVLDIGTGGGEVFSEILTGYSGVAVATEPWAPNVPVAAGQLQRHRAHVVHASSLVLPFRNEVFDLVLDRHEELEPAEVARVLAPGGHALTQQAHSNRNWKELEAFFPRRSDFGPHFERYQDGFRAAGLVIMRAETHATPIAFRDLGEIAYLLTALPWEVPGFDLERDLDALLGLDAALRRPEGIVMTEAHYIIEAWKPG